MERVNYIQSELNKLEREQEAIDLKANALEKKLRAVMGGTMTSELREHSYVLADNSEKDINVLFCFI